MTSKMIAVLFFITLSSVLGFFTRINAISNQAFMSSRGDASRVRIKAVTLEDLPYAYNALEPHISERTLQIHHDRHHAKYVATTNELIQGTELENADIETIVRAAHSEQNQALFNNAGQSFNHDFYWKSMKPNGGGTPYGKLAELIARDFGDFATFREKFVSLANTAFGSGWAWLYWTPEGLKVSQTIGAGNPLTEPNAIPLLTVDVWEHAYYLDYQNMRTTYVDGFMNSLVDWDVVAARLPKDA